jgi:hypothetical protein
LFGEYRGAPLFQVAQTDSDYLRWLALTAQRPQVRAAAMQLVRALEASQQSSGGRRTPKTSSQRHDGSWFFIVQEGLRDGDDCAGVTFSVGQVGRAVGAASEDEEVLAVDNPAWGAPSISM